MNETTVLCLTIQNAKYPITLVNFGFCFLDLQISNPLIFFNIQDIIRKICSITGQLLRICILRKRALQVLVEFDSIETARRIKNELDGADIYSGCCTLKIDFANVNKNKNIRIKIFFDFLFFHLA